MRRAALLLCLALPLALHAGDAPAPPAQPPVFKPSGAFKLLPGKHGVSVALDTDLPAQAIVQVYLKREQFSAAGTSEPRLVDSQRFVLNDKRPVQLEMNLRWLLPPAWYDVEVVYDSQGQYPAVQKKLAGVGSLREGFKLSIGTPEEIALEHEWGETRVLGAMRRLDQMVAKLEGFAQAPPSAEAWQAFWPEQERRIGWLAERLGKVGASSPVAEVYFPQSEAALGQLCGQVRALGPRRDPPGFAQYRQARAAADKAYAEELTGRTLAGLGHWRVFVHQEYWLNRIHKRLSKEQWEGFKAEQRKQLDALEAGYTAYVAKDDPVKSAIARNFPRLVPDCAALLRELQGAYDADLAEGLENPGPRTGAVDAKIRRLFNQASGGE